ncbi:hypothetical protein HK405_015672, partial [Cladochytrium tenue]
MGADVVYVKVGDAGKPQPVKLASAGSLPEARAAVMAAAKLAAADRDRLVLRLYNQSGDLVPIGPHLPPNSAEAPYKLEVK